MDETTTQAETAARPQLKDEQTRTVYPLTDSGNAERLITKYGTTLRYVEAWKSWVAYRPRKFVGDLGGKWDREGGEVIAYSYARRIARDIRVSADEQKAILREHGIETADGLKRIEKLRTWSIHSESTRAIDAMLKLVARDAKIAAPPSLFLNTDPYLFNVANGTIDLRTGVLTSHKPEHYLTQISPVSYNPTATCPRYDQFMEEVFRSNPEVIPYMDRLLGYALTGDTKEAVLPILHGPTTRNGKTTLLNTIHALMGDYGCPTSIETFMVKRPDAATQGLARLFGKRFVNTSEAEEGQRLNSSLLKQMSGASWITAREMYGSDVSAKPTFKVFVDTNELPRVSDSDAMFARLHVIPFDECFLGREDKDLPDVLLTELQGILARLVQGCLEWQKNGLNPPPVVTSRTSDYRKALNPCADFFDECLRVTDSESFILASTLHERYVKWCTANGQKPLASQKALTTQLKKLAPNMQSKTVALKNERPRVWRGITWKV